MLPRTLLFAAIFALLLPQHARSANRAGLYDPRQFGAKADGVTDDTDALQKAIDTCAEKGGTVVLSSGTFLVRPIVLKARMTFRIEKGAVLLGSARLADYPEMLPENPSTKALCRSLIYACNADELRIEGDGVIDGQCKEMNLPPEVTKNGTEPLRPSLIRIFRSRGVVVRGIALKNPAMWTQIYAECDQLLVEQVKVDAPAVCPNLDGIDICDSNDVVVRDCDIRSEDDSIVLKSHSRRGLSNILIENNKVHCHRANGIKIGTATVGPIQKVVIRHNTITHAKYGGLVLASVDGSAVSDILVQDLQMENVAQPIFIRLGKRSTKSNDLATGQRPAGSIRNVTLERIRVTKTHSETQPSCSISGILGARIENVRIKDCEIEMPGGVKESPALPAEREGDYPQSNMFGLTPASAFFVRHADGIVFENVKVTLRSPDVRPWLSCSDAGVEWK